MFHARERLPHLLPPSAYSSAENYSWELTNVFSHSWHFAALQSELSRPGDFVTLDIAGTPIQVRNFDGTIHAVSNVCAHRHCLLTSEAKGHTQKMRCQYHGWQYDASGATQRIPLAQHFAPLDRALTKISVYRIETIGPLVFVNLDPTAPDLTTCLGGRLEPKIRGLNEGWEVILSRQFHQAVNWKIPVENSLEAYHVPAVHSETFREDPGEELSEHVLGEWGSSFHTSLPFSAQSKVDAWFQTIEGHVVKGLTGCTPTATYQQHHVFPNVLFSFTDMATVLHVVRPTGPQSCTSMIYQFGRVGKSFLSRQYCRLWGRLAASITSRILKEDILLYPDIQRGLNASQNPGMLGRCEERIYQFQRWLQNQPSRPSVTNSPVADDEVESASYHDCSPTILFHNLAQSWIEL